MRKTKLRFSVTKTPAKVTMLKTNDLSSHGQPTPLGLPSKPKLLGKEEMCTCSSFIHKVVLSVLAYNWQNIQMRERECVSKTTSRKSVLA